MYKTNIQTGNQYLPDGSTYLKLWIIFEHDDTGTDRNWYTYDKNILVEDWGTISWNYDLDQLLLVPGRCVLKLSDLDSVLFNLFFGIDAIGLITDKRAKIKIYRNTTLVFSGKIAEDAIDYDVANYKVEIQAFSDLDLLNKTMVYDEDGASLNPLSYSDSTYYNTVNLIHEIYKEVDSSIALTVKHTWDFYGLKNTAPGDFRLYDIDFTEIKQNSHYLYFDTSRGITSLGDALKKLAMDWGCFTGLLNDEEAFFSKIFYYDPDDLQSLGRVLSHRVQYKFNLKEYVKIKVLGVSAYYTEGNYLEIEDKILTRDETIVFFYCDAFNRTFIGTSGTDVYADINRPDNFVFYDIYDTDMSIGDIYSNNGSEFKIVTKQPPYLVMLKSSGTNDPTSSGDLVKVSGTGTTPLTYSNVFELDGVDFEIYRAVDEYAGITTSNGYDFGRLLALYWYKYRGNIENCRVDKFIVGGINYHLLKCFNYDGKKYQPISLKLNLAKYTSEIEAIYLGEL